MCDYSGLGKRETEAQSLQGTVYERIILFSNAIHILGKISYDLLLPIFWPDILCFPILATSASNS